MTRDDRGFEGEDLAYLFGSLGAAFLVFFALLGLIYLTGL